MRDSCWMTLSLNLKVKTSRTWIFPSSSAMRRWSESALRQTAVTVLRWLHHRTANIDTTWTHTMLSELSTVQLQNLCFMHNYYNDTKYYTNSYRRWGDYWKLFLRSWKYSPRPKDEGNIRVYCLLLLAHGYPRKNLWIWMGNFISTASLNISEGK